MATSSLQAESARANPLDQMQLRLSLMQTQFYKVRALAFSIESASESIAAEVEIGAARNIDRAWSIIDGTSQLIANLMDDLLKEADEIERGLSTLKEGV